MLPEKACGSNATRVERGKRDASLFVVATVKLLHCEHVANLAVLICLGSIKVTTINHS